jgi:hypothetical protein
VRCTRRKTAAGTSAFSTRCASSSKTCHSGPFEEGGQQHTRRIFEDQHGAAIGLDQLLDVHDLIAVGQMPEHDELVLVAASGGVLRLVGCLQQHRFRQLGHGSEQQVSTFGQLPGDGEARDFPCLHGSLSPFLLFHNNLLSFFKKVV